MFRIILIILILLPTISNADQGLKISCLNMKSIYGKKYEPLKFTLEAVGFKYFDIEKAKFVMINASELNIGENQFTARFEDYELGFRITLFPGDAKPTMTMSKYDFKNKKFLEHYKCEAEMSFIN